jgi:tRNA(fMet)-specific endonuclease VapC
LASLATEEVIIIDQADGELAGRISAIALGHSLELGTGNTAHFQRVQQLGCPLVLMNWRQQLEDYHCR